MKTLFKQAISLLLILSIAFSLNAQDPLRFKEQVDKLAATTYPFTPEKKLALFTGSSSVRMWNDVQAYFPDYNVINNGFGGSHFSDLIFYYNQLIVPFHPDILFIYEGDNDIAAKKKPGEILKEAKFLVSKIQRDLPATKTVIISPKPSIARWEIRKDYEKLNNKLKRLAKKTDNLEFADVWTPMLDEKEVVLQDVFLSDNLHMNQKGYDIWAKVLTGFLK